jgi:PEP-CTERM motif
MKIRTILACGGVLAITGGIAFAAATASDSAANYVGGSWSVGSTPNLGFGFGAWSTPNNNNNPPYAGTYLDLASYGNPDAVNGGTASWGTYANGGSSAYVQLVRPFTAGPSGSANLYNQTFSFAIGSWDIGGAGSSISAAVGNLFVLSYAGGGADLFTLSTAGGPAIPIPVSLADLKAGLEVSVMVYGPLNSPTDVATFTISPFAGGLALFSAGGSYNGSTFSTSSFTFSDYNTTQDQFVNDLNISPESVPEPSTLAVLGLSGIALVLRRRK